MKDCFRVANERRSVKIEGLKRAGKVQESGGFAGHRSEVDMSDGNLFLWNELKLLADEVGITVELAEELLQPEIAKWREFFGQEIISRAQLHLILSERLQHAVDSKGFSGDEAALYLGMSESSFDQLLASETAAIPVFHNSNGQTRFLQKMLDAFVDRFLPAHKTWASRTGVLREFFKNLESKLGIHIEPRYCEIEGCQHLAVYVCSNPNCRPGTEPRVVCARHREVLRSDYQKSLCCECVPRVLYGDLQESSFDLGRSRERLVAEYPHG